MKTHSPFINLAAVAGIIFGAWLASAAQLTLPIQHRASGVQWGPGYSVPNNEQHLEVGAVPQAFGVGNGNTSTQLRFDVTPLDGVFTSINSVTLRLTQFFSHDTRAPAVVEAHRLLPANADWNNNGNYGTKDGVNAWAGGASGALVEGTDYEAAILGSVTVNPPNPVGTTYDLVIAGPAAANLINAWLAGPNEGLLLRANPPAPDADNRVGFDLSGANAPRLTVNYTPLGGPTITQHPADTSGPEGGSATFTVTANGAPPLRYQWTREGADIANATNTSYTLSNLGTNDNGARFACVVTDGANLSATSSSATLTVIPDSTAPTLLGAAGVNFTTVEVTFSEPVSADTATKAGNYTISDEITVLSAAHGANPAMAILTTTPQVVGNTYTLAVSGVRDASSGGNLIAPGSTATFTTPASMVTFAAQHRASGAEWAPAFSEPNGEQLLAAGAVPSAFGVGHGRQSTQLRFDVTALNGGYSAIQSMTIRLTQKLRTPGREAGTLEAYRLLPDNADWNNNGTFGTKDGSNPWAGGASGALVPDVDYDNFLLGSAAYDPVNPVDTVYDLVIPGSIATDLINAWASGAGNEGFLIRGVVPEGYAGDNRVLFYHEGPSGPKLIVEFSPLTLAITQQPADVTGDERGSATFTVGLSGAPPYTYQWRRDGTDIPGATNSSYTISNLQTNDAGARFSVRVGDTSGSQVTSGSGILTVTPDSAPPILLSATGLDFMHVRVTFSEPVSMATANDPANYTLDDGLAVLSAALTADPTTVLLTTCPQTPGSDYTLAVTGLRDASSGNNLIAPGATATFTTPPSRLTLTPQHRASGVQWAPGFSEPNIEDLLIVGAVPAAFGVGNGNTSTQLRFDVSALAGSTVNSVTIHLTQNLSLPREAGTLEVYRLLPANAGWNNNGTYGTKDGSNPWAGGANGALVAGTDYDPTLLGSVSYNPAAPAGTVYDVVISGAPAAALINAWTTGVNAGLLLKGVVPEGFAGDNRCTFYQGGPNGPELIVDYPAVYHPTLHYSRAGSQLTLWWDCPGFILESTDQLPSASWAPVPGVVNNRVTVDTTTGTRFFRLRTP